MLGDCAQFSDDIHSAATHASDDDAFAGKRLRSLVAAAVQNLAGKRVRTR